MSTIPDPKPDWSPWMVIEAAQKCHGVLDDHCLAHGGSYSLERDLTYREFRSLLIDGLHEFPCFEEVSVPTIITAYGDFGFTIPKREDALPSTLTKVSCERTFVEMRRHSVAKFLSDLLTAVQNAGVPRPESPEPPTVEPAASAVVDAPRHDSRDERPGKPMNRAMRRAAERRPQSREMRAAGHLVKEIAHNFGVSTRTIENDLKESASDHD